VFRRVGGPGSLLAEDGSRGTVVCKLRPGETTEIRLNKKKLIVLLLV